MTDFLHLSSTPTSLNPEQDVLTKQNGEVGSREPDKELSQPLPNASTEDQTNKVEERGDEGQSSSVSGQPTPEPVRRNFASSGKKQSAPPQQTDPNGEEVKHIVRKESPLLVHYYQSIFLLLIALFVASGYFVLSPLILEFKEVNQMIRFRLQEKDDATVFLQSVNRSIEAAQSISPEVLAKINEALPNEVEVPILLKTFYQLADQNGVKMGGIQFSPQGASSDSQTIGGYGLAPIQISLSIQAPGYHVMRKYLEDLQTNIQLMDVKSISVSGDESSGEFTYSLELTTYTIQKVANTPPPSQAIPMGGGVAPPSAPGVAMPNDI